MTSSRVRLSLLATALAAAATLAPGAPAAATTWQVPGSASITVVGHGNGHGHGLSQYGAQRAATKGLGYRQILRYYYPGTSSGKAGGAIKVLLTADTSRDLVVAARPGLTARSVAGGRSLDLAKARPKARLWRITPLAGKRSAIDFKTGSWRRLTVVKGDAELSAGGRPLRLFVPGGSHAYRGALRSASPRSGTSLDRDTVNVVGLDAYLKGVVAREVPSYWHPQALRAQAVAARTYAAFDRATTNRGHYDLCDTDACQVYGGFTDEVASTSAAVDATRGQVQTKAGKAIFAQFNASSGGWTSAGAFSYLPAKVDKYDAFPGNDFHDWTVPTSDARIEAQWPEIGDLTSIETSDRDGHGAWGGRVGTVTLTGTDGSVDVTGDDFRFLLGLYSTWFTIRVS
ncbi:hypothetical protein NPS01_34030 [Nocardioides psychrotolerans]|uniref:SpoIID/LytB domain protein n=1 Tax=Nocardioides psychrotolerans TaxID=1005945 RepID=A0A1I3CG83_9ACTN|nr:SpoIID/LytB domain-containing protein [Nocardioides psychrotolerans]GEP39740.1 hypothetical protein NPS01_34030 [Nocardioides psychrotolerans]SFH73393.1 SpoIID/LytB domain protein [Nocardioides psychrotolerans]